MIACSTTPAMRRWLRSARIAPAAAPRRGPLEQRDQRRKRPRRLVGMSGEQLLGEVRQRGGFGVFFDLRLMGTGRHSR